MIKEVDIEGSYLFIVFKQNERLKFTFFLKYFYFESGIRRRLQDNANLFCQSSFMIIFKVILSRLLIY